MLGAVFVLAYAALSYGIVHFVGTLFGFVPALAVGGLLAAFLVLLVGGGIMRMTAPPRPATRPTTPAEPSDD